MTNRADVDADTDVSPVEVGPSNPDSRSLRFSWGLRARLECVCMLFIFAQLMVPDFASPFRDEVARSGPRLMAVTLPSTEAQAAQPFPFRDCHGQLPEILEVASANSARHLHQGRPNSGRGMD